MASNQPEQLLFFVHVSFPGFWKQWLVCRWIFLRRPARASSNEWRNVPWRRKRRWMPKPRTTSETTPWDRVVWIQWRWGSEDCGWNISSKWFDIGKPNLVLFEIWQKLSWNLLLNQIDRRWLERWPTWNFPGPATKVFASLPEEMQRLGETELTWEKLTDTVWHQAFQRQVASSNTRYCNWWLCTSYSMRWT